MSRVFFLLFLVYFFHKKILKYRISKNIYIYSQRMKEDEEECITFVKVVQINFRGGEEP